MKTMVTEWARQHFQTRSRHPRLELLLRIAAALAWNGF
jgi:hypothetical protein